MKLRNREIKRISCTNGQPKIKLDISQIHIYFFFLRVVRSALSDRLWRPLHSFLFPTSSLSVRRSPIGAKTRAAMLQNIWRIRHSSAQTQKFRSNHATAWPKRRYIYLYENALNQTLRQSVTYIKYYYYYLIETAYSVLYIERERVRGLGNSGENTRKAACTVHE